MKLNEFALFFSVLLLTSCAGSRKTAVSQKPKEVVMATATQLPPKTSPLMTSIETRTDSFLEELLKDYPQYFQAILNNRDSLRVQVIYTMIDRQANNSPVFKNYYFNVNPGKYFYPASTVKLPVAVLALQKLNELKVFGLNSNSTMITESNYSGQTATYNDPTAEDGKPSIAQYIKKIFLVSDNDAFNRLYEFLGQEYINDQLHKMGYTDAEILHRLSIFLSEDENRHTNPVKFRKEDGNLLYEQPMQVNLQNYSSRNDSLANAYYNGNVLVNQPMNFSKKNRIALEDLHSILKSIIFPESVPMSQRFNLTTDDYHLLWRYMSQLPTESDYPALDTSVFYDTYGKLLLYGREKNKSNAQIRIFNKEGDAYGCLTDVAYIADFDKRIEFMLSATIYCNADGVMNDDKYDYESVGIPFLKHLGEAIYNYEEKRRRAYQPDLSNFKLEYPKSAAIISAE